MRLALLSDIHANLQAVEAVLADVRHQKVSEIVSLGDIIGYGPQPEEVATLLLSEKIPSVMGNHEFALISRRYYKSLNPTARTSIDITRQLMSEKTLRHVATLPPFQTIEGCRCVHGCPPNSITRYLFNPSDERLHRLLSLFPERICFFGHTHNLAIYAIDGDGEIEKRRLVEERFVVREGQRCIINIGSVGQPRDGNNNAKYAIYDTSDASVEIRFVPYDVEETKKRILARGLPEFNARRLG